LTESTSTHPYFNDELVAAETAQRCQETLHVMWHLTLVSYSRHCCWS